MKNISGQYQDLLEGKMSQAQFLRNARMMFPSFVTQHNSFADSITILKQKGMLNEGDAVKGTPDKEPTYASLTPDDKIKYKKVEQSPEVDEQDGIYPATTITDIPKEKTYKKVKNTSDGLEPIKDNDTKNEMKKVKVVKEGIHNAARNIAKDDIKLYAAQERKKDKESRKGYSDDLPTDSHTVGSSHVINKDSNRLNRVLKRDYPDLEENISPEEIEGAEIEITTNDASIQDMADKMGISQEELFKMLLKKLGGLQENLGHNEISSIHQEGRFWIVTYRTADGTKEKSFESEKEARKFYSTIDENQRSFDDIFADFIETDDSTEIKAYIKSKGKEAISKIKAELPKTPDRIRKVLAKLMKIELDEMKTNKTSFDYKSTFEDLVMKTNTASKSDFGSIKQNWIERVENSKINPDTKKQMLNSIKAINSLLDLQKFASYGLLKYEKMAIKAEAQTQQIPPDTVSLLSILKRIEAQTKAKFFAISNADELKDVFDYILDRVNPTLASSATQLRTALNQAVQSNLDAKKLNKNTAGQSGPVAPKLESLISKIMNETLSKKSAR